MKLNLGKLDCHFYNTECNNTLNVFSKAMSLNSIRWSAFFHSTSSHPSLFRFSDRPNRAIWKNSFTRNSLFNSHGSHKAFRCLRLRCQSSVRENDNHFHSQDSLSDLCNLLQGYFFELCVKNEGRPAGEVLSDFVLSAVHIFHRFDRKKMNLELAYKGVRSTEFHLNAIGYRLTSSEERYFYQWLDIVFITLKCLKNENDFNFEKENSDDEWLASIVHRVLEGQRTGEDLSAVKFDRALATRGASGGTASQSIVIAPQWIPATQLVLLTMKVYNERQFSA